MAEEQLTLQDVEASLAAEGIAEIPDGLGELSVQEVKFVLELIRTGQMARSAVAAGYSADNAGPAATHTLARPRVLRFYRQCLQKVAENHDTILERAMQRAVLAHTKFLEAAQSSYEAQELLFVAMRSENGKAAKDVAEYETAYNRRQREEAKYFKMAQDADGHLLAALGRAGIQVNVGGAIDINSPNNRQVPAEALGFLANVRRDLQKAQVNRLADLPLGKPANN